VPLRGEGAPKNNGQIKHLIEYLLTVYKRFGNTAVTCDLQWGAVALHKRDAQKERIEQLEAALRELVRLKELKDKVIDAPAPPFEGAQRRSDAIVEYERGKPLAWQAAREALK
jgi:hypothetical protein